MSRGKRETNWWSLTHIFGSRDYVGQITIKNTLTQVREKTTNATQDQIKFER